MLYQDNPLLNKTKQTGSAIVVALFVVALVAISATAMLTRIQQDTRRAELLLNSNKAYLYAQGSIAWAIDQLNNDYKDQQPQQVIDKTPIHSPAKTIENATVKSTIYDAQGFFNLNNLADTNYHENFSNLLKAVIPNMSANDIQTISQATTAWIMQGGAATNYDEYYGKQTPAYRAPHRPMASMSELLLVKGMTSELYTKLSPYIIALPGVTAVNVNNAEAPVLMSLNPKLTLDSAKTIQSICHQTPFASTQSFRNMDTVKNNDIPDTKITIVSTYFLVKTNVTIGDQTTILYTLLQREIKNSQPMVTITWQSKGTL